MSIKNVWPNRAGRSWRPSRMLWTVMCVALALVLSMGNALQALAAAGDLDTTFDVDGRVTTDFAGDGAGANAVAIQSDGKIVAAGFVHHIDNNDDFAVARYNSDGSPDMSFGGNGRVFTDFFGGTDDAQAVAIQSDGKIVVGGTAQHVDINDGFYFALARYNSDGSPDMSFGGDGKIHTGFVTFSILAGLAIQSDGKIVAVGDANDDFAVARYNSNGSLDTSFSGNGKRLIDFGGDVDGATSVAIQANGKIVVAGYTAPVNSGIVDFALARLTTAGELDTGFSGDGKLTTTFSEHYALAHAVAIQADGKIVVAGVAKRPDLSFGFALARYASDGALDTTFSGNGKVTTGFGGPLDEAFGLAIQYNGRIVAAGARRSADGHPDNFILARYNSDGTLDTTFSGNGKVTTGFGGTGAGGYAVAVQPNGKIVAAGLTITTAGYDRFALARYEGETRVPPTPVP